MRIPLAFYSDVVCKGTVELCADESARDEGDARRAIFLLTSSWQFCYKDRMYYSSTWTCNDGISKN